MFLCVLSLAVFAQGMSEFMLSGLVPAIAGDLHVGVAAAASLTSAYAIGMVVGAPVMAALSARWPRRRALAVFLVVFIVVHVVGAVTADFAVLFGSRVVAAVANAGFLAVALPVASTVAGPGREARATATLLAGVTLACVFGVPGGALLGELFGWRSAFWAVAGLSVPALVLVLRVAPVTPAGQNVVVRKEFRVLLARPVWHALVLGTLVNGATFATFAYLAVVSPAPATVVLAAFGAGAFCGVVVAGRFGHLSVAGLSALPVGWLALALASNDVAFLVLTVLQGALSFGVGSALVARVLAAATDAPTLGGSFATVALNVGAVFGPLLAGVVTNPMVVSAVLASGALVLLPLRGREPDDSRVVQSGR